MLCGEWHYFVYFRNIQNGLIKFQSSKPSLWIEAAEQVRSWIESDQDIDFFEEETRTDAGDSMYERMRRKNKTMMIKIPNMMNKTKTEMEDPTIAKMMATTAM